MSEAAKVVTSTGSVVLTPQVTVLVDRAVRRRTGARRAVAVGGAVTLERNIPSAVSMDTGVPTPSTKFGGPWTGGGVFTGAAATLCVSASAAHAAVATAAQHRKDNCDGMAALF